MFMSESDYTPRAVRSRHASCDPVSLTVASVAIAGAGAGASIAGQQQANSAGKQVEKQKQDAVTKQIEENRARATSDYIASVNDERTQQAQEQ